MKPRPRLQLLLPKTRHLIRNPFPLAAASSCFVMLRAHGRILLSEKMAWVPNGTNKAPKVDIAPTINNYVPRGQKECQTRAKEIMIGPWMKLEKLMLSKFLTSSINWVGFLSSFYLVMQCEQGKHLNLCRTKLKISRKLRYILSQAFILLQQWMDRPLSTFKRLSVNIHEMRYLQCMGHNRGWEEAASMLSGASVELKTCNAALLEGTGKSWEEIRYNLIDSVEDQPEGTNSGKQLSGDSSLVVLAIDF